MAIINVRDRKLGSDDVAWGMGSYSYTDANGVVRTTPEVNATIIPATDTEFIWNFLLDIKAVSTSGELIAALADFGSSYGTIYLRRNTYEFSAPLTIPPNVRLWAEYGALINANNALVTIQSPITAGPYTLFSWSGAGAFDISESPTPDVYIQWWGALPGVANDCTAAVSKAFDSIGSQHNIFFTEGIWRITSPIIKGSVSSYTDRRYGMRGSDRHLSTVYIDVGAANDGFYLAGAYFDFRDMSFIGPANCCRNGMVVGGYGGCGLHAERVNLFMGATDYAIRLSGVIYGKIMDMDIGHFDGLYGVAPYNCHWSTNGIAFMKPLDYPPHDYGNNALDILVNISHMNKGIYMDNCENVKVRGSVEACTYPIYMNGQAYAADGMYHQVQHIDIDNMYLTDGNTHNAYISGAKQTTFNNCYMEEGDTVVTDSHYTNFKNCRLVSLEIRPDAHQTILDNVGVITTLKNSSESTICVSPTYDVTQKFQARPSNPPQAVNIITNSGFEKFSTTAPEGWTVAGGTWTQEATIIHHTTYAAKFNTNGGDRQPQYNFSTEQLKQLKGQFATASMWVRIDSAPATYGYFYLNLTVPTWGASTAYNLGDCVLPTAPAGFMYKAVAVTGDAKSGAVEPAAWPTGFALQITDNHVTWMCIQNGGRSVQLDSTFINNYQQMTVSGLIPANATVAAIWFNCYKGAAADVNYYFAEPCISPGLWSPDFYLAGKGEFNGYIMLNGLKIGADSVIPTGVGSIYSTNYHGLGDRVLGINTAVSAWFCTSVGIPGGWST